MFNLTKKKKISFYSIVGLSVIFLLLVGLQLFLSGNVSNGEGNLNFSIYQSSTAKISKLQEAYKDGVFNDPLFIKLKSIFRLPLETGQIGKDNPFLLPLPPEVKIPVR